jgi:hypothetical protein
MLLVVGISKICSFQPSSKSSAKNLHIVFLMQTIRGTKIEANFRNFVPKHFAEENTLSILFAGTGNFLFYSLSQKRGS